MFNETYLEYTYLGHSHIHSKLFDTFCQPTSIYFDNKVHIFEISNKKILIITGITIEVVGWCDGPDGP